MALFPRYQGPALINQICSVENLTLAWRRVRSNIRVARRRSSAGTDSMTLRDFETNWSRHMTQLADELQSGTYRALPPRRVQIPKSSGGARAIAILAVRDRVAQRAVQQVIQPLFEPYLLDCSYGCRQRVGVEAAVTRVARYAEQGLNWAVDADVASFFDTIDQRILLTLVRQRIGEPAVLQLIAQWLRAGSLEIDETGPLTADGRPAGGSALLARTQALLSRLTESSAEPMPPMPSLAPDPLLDPYGVDAWEVAGPASPLGGRRGGTDQWLWTAMMLAKPALQGARQALPYIQRVGGQRALIAGAVAAAVVAAGEVGLRMQDGLGRGTAQGGALSPLLANIYLHPFDVALTSQGLRLVRFMDDFVIMCADENEAGRALDLARRQLLTLRLNLHPEKTRVVAYSEGLEFLGQALAPRRRGPTLGEGLTSFNEVEPLLRQAATQARAGAKAVRGRLRRPKK